MFLLAENIKKSYGTVNVLKGIDVNIEKAEFVTIIGKSGAGKSTLLHILGTLDKADEGKLIIFGEDVTRYSSDKLADFRNRHIGFVFQFHHLLPEFTAYENVIIPAMIARRRETDYRIKAEQLLDYLGLTDRMGHKPGELSGGEQQRVAIARALINDPSIIMADEPTGNLDSTTSAEIHELIARLRKELGVTFIIVTHNIELTELSDRSLKMSDGLIIKT
ncbi:MAG TPA: ABC transporter ATP-binding protein [Saprospiraceae bacterium]|nr:ABC transporter ATP-binding protein [Saprospiraceae bacterium]MCC6688138.1 ABC transporter ATP-binding protein [Saprospiraceae bacterium]HMX81957.1 ABC transporter ATP-binding protein [Saprospiraceae bacterium]HMZ74112.1 ABC transporter ATP-binding protein [Saprospiraceae bacterium]HNA41110.1 ABC transporter ATP-binding protein [Saprospiraceae bacterium]